MKIKRSGPTKLYSFLQTLSNSSPKKVKVDVSRLDAVGDPTFASLQDPVAAILHLEESKRARAESPGAARVFNAKASEPLLGSERQKEPTVSAVG